MEERGCPPSGLARRGQGTAPFTLVQAQRLLSPLRAGLAPTHGGQEQSAADPPCLRMRCRQVVTQKQIKSVEVFEKNVDRYLGFRV